MTDLETLAAHALQRAGDPDCPVPEASLWLAIATDIEDYVTGEMLCVTTLFGVIPGVEFGTIGTGEAAPDMSPEPPLNTPIERSIHMNSNASKPVPPRESRGVA